MLLKAPGRVLLVGHGQAWNKPSRCCLSAAAAALRCLLSCCHAAYLALASSRHLQQAATEPQYSGQLLLQVNLSLSYLLHQAHNYLLRQAHKLQHNMLKHTDGNGTQAEPLLTSHP
jgi:hypothetical protein